MQQQRLKHFYTSQSACCHVLSHVGTKKVPYVMIKLLWFRVREVKLAECLEHVHKEDDLQLETYHRLIDSFKLLILS